MVAKSLNVRRMTITSTALFVKGRKIMPIEIRYQATTSPQVSHEEPGLRFTEANFPLTSMDCGRGNIFGSYPVQGFRTLDSDMCGVILTGYVSLQEEGQEPVELGPFHIFCIPKGTGYRWQQVGEEEVLLFASNSPPFDPAKR
jgi:hypothetical protein